MQEVSIDAMNLDEIEPNDPAALDGADKGVLPFDYFSRVIALGLGKSSEKRLSPELQTIFPEGHFSLTVNFEANDCAPLEGHPFSSLPAVQLEVRGTPRGSLAAHGAYVLAYLLECASWTPIFVPFACTKLTIRWSRTIYPSSHIPLSLGEIRPSGRTAVASMVMAADLRVAQP